MISVVLYPEAADSPPYAATEETEEGRKEGRGGEISKAFGLAECEIVSDGERDFGDWHSCVARI